MNRNICTAHTVSFSEIVECNKCNMLTGFVLINTKTGAVFLAINQPNFWAFAKHAKEFAKKYSIAKSWKPKLVYIHFD